MSNKLGTIKLSGTNNPAGFSLDANGWVSLPLPVAADFVFNLDVLFLNPFFEKIESNINVVGGIKNNSIGYSDSFDVKSIPFTLQAFHSKLKEFKKLNNYRYIILEITEWAFDPTDIIPVNKGLAVAITEAGSFEAVGQYKMLSFGLTGMYPRSEV